MKRFYLEAIEAVRAKSSGAQEPSRFDITINFHPDRLTRDGRPLLEAIAEDGQLKSQFETGTSNGGLTAYQGGERWRWEQRVFDGSYDNAADYQRPKYGALNYLQHPGGASPRFGSAFFRLKPELMTRTTFCYPDSYFEPDHFATHEHLPALIDQAEQDKPDFLDAYIEAQIHGEVLLASDIDSLWLDAVYRGTEVEAQAAELGLPVRWHNGYQLDIETMAQYPDYRGPQYLELARELAVDGVITADLLGRAVNERRFDEQDVKKVWHYLARFGYRGGKE
ncbi:DUF3626 domain-containing protein [Ferrimonas marina]|uniref:DUF3626 domain-containing protein n=1 Tax=Ferrimonas marina TaxID=299255 RepID=A0A1M5MPX3_9GAMM|nr:DUF3626 domain-containing protein [Ferrimonas marina]SHG79460.1 Protein of unknown function [Ferrimonas marina]